MPKYIFQKFKDPDNQYDVTNVTMEIDTDGRAELLEEFEAFLKAVGFSFKGHIDIVEEE